MFRRQMAARSHFGQTESRSRSRLGQLTQRTHLTITGDFINQIPDIKSYDTTYHHAKVNM